MTDSTSPGPTTSASASAAGGSQPQQPAAVPTGGPANSAQAQPPSQPAAEPHELQAPANTTGQQPFAHDANHEQNEVAGASRGEFGRQSDQGITQGGYGAELSRGGATYAGTLDTPAATTGYIGEREQRPAGFEDAGNGSYGTQPVGGTAPAGSAVGAQFANDNAAPQGPDSGFADNYGTSSLGGTRAGSSQPDATQRNQREDYRPSHPDGGPEGQRTGVAATNTSQGTDEADATPTAGSRSGYEAANSPDAQGSEKTGFGSRGGSYNDEYDAATNSGDQTDSSPSRGDYSQENAARNYGGASDDRTSSDRRPDYGPMPGRPGSPE
ncbi:hypothetical protein HNQ93_000337 [Hymenobacter luteus]|uniref:Uncharacterized protein n=2 Tax=Hymenobacter TaxID=89966 RepID=A0A7W9SX38_9BACT|nr:MULTISPECIES: hypothetical protein [Hymenobacter]MBB4600183.1 hypothetical protein [Hymenobacter latericoloratus]MBB6057507.1 hypothetical protein [Hymenobacter luteus]